MARFRTLLKDTWWLWIAFFLAATLLSVFVDKVFLVAYPICIFVFLYFGYVRYDEEGKFRGG
ncbi:MAG: hypothetical protein U0892_23205 [Pirellulales bacterium]